MDGTALALFLLSAFFGGVTTGLAGFAMGLVVSGVWLHVLTPVQTASLIVGYGLLVQAHGVVEAAARRRIPQGRAADRGRRHRCAARDLCCSLISSRPMFALPSACCSLLYSLYGMLRPKLAPVPVSLPADLAVGLVNGVLGGLTGLAGPIVVIWCQLTGVPWAVQRAIFQPVILAVFAMTALGLGLGGAITAEVAKLFALGLVPVLAGIWVGLHLYGRLEEAGFRRLILAMLLLSGLVLLLPALR